MKTIKELEDNETNDMESGYCMALKDVLKLIDELPCMRGHFDGKKMTEDLIEREELKQKIKGK